MTPDLVSAREIAERLGVKPGTVHQWRYRGLLPDPDYQLSVGHVWNWSTISEWDRHRKSAETDEMF